jgi:hypothetical protein
VISFDTSILVYPTTAGRDAKAQRAREIITLDMETGSPRR